MGVVVNLSSTSSQTVNGNLTLILSSASVFNHVIGGSQIDTLTGNAGNNTLTGGPGNDTLTGGAGNNTYVFDADSALGTDTLIEGGGGVFDVAKDEKLIFSKKKEGRFPKPGEVVGILRP